MKSSRRHFSLHPDRRYVTLPATLLVLSMAGVACSEDTSVIPSGDLAVSDVDSDARDDAASSDSAAEDILDTTGGDDDAAPDAAEDAALPIEHPALVGTVPATFTVRPGVEIATAFDVTPGAPITLYDAQGERIVTYLADEFGQVHFAYVPREYGVYDLKQAVSGELVKDGSTLPPGDGYVLRDDSAMPEGPALASAPFRVLATTEHPDVALYDGQDLQGIPFGILGVPADVDVNDGFNYITMRDGVKLGAMVRFPDPALWGDGPYPTVVEYSGYGPSDPGSPDPGSRIATLLGYATVGVNMRGTGCSGGVFDIFSPAQHADGYDIIEVVSRQPWVAHGKVGMVGLSYPGISELYVAYLNPPGLAAITPLSVLYDPWVVLRPGGIYNDGFTRQWLAQRDAEAASGGQSWTDGRIALGDTICDEHQTLRNQNLAFEEVFKALEFYPPQAEARSIWRLVSEIKAAVYLTGGFQDEQTGPQFADMLGHFDAAAVRRFILYNGRHVDGYSPLVLTRWWEFLELYVARRVPRLPEWMRTIGAEEFSKSFDSTGLTFEPDRYADFADDDYEGVRAAYEAEPDVRVLFESGGVPENPGAPLHRFEASFDAWPPSVAATRTLHLGPDGTLVDAAPAEASSASYRHDPEAGADTFFGPKGYETTARMWDIDWRPFAADAAATFTTAALPDDLILAGPGYLRLFLSSEVDDVHVQVTLTELRPDGQEVLVTTGWHRVGHRQINTEPSAGNYVHYTWTQEDFALLAPGEVIDTRVPIPSIAHVFRKGSQLRVSVSTPGRNHGTWEFTNPAYGGEPPVHTIAFGGDTPSALVLSTVPVSSITGGVIPASLPVCPGLRGQPCRQTTAL
ncbi:MAG: CocE/NonD family hydrolase [Myxococcales bacterium]|nr:CocE/NonD family hydrolase [Myxococcales bacterium]